MVAQQPIHPKDASGRHIIQQKAPNLAIAITATSTRRNVMRPHGVAKTVTFYLCHNGQDDCFCMYHTRHGPSCKCVFTHSKTRTSAQICIDMCVLCICFVYGHQCLKYMCVVYVCTRASMLERRVLCMYVPGHQCLKDIRCVCTYN